MKFAFLICYWNLQVPDGVCFGQLSDAGTMLSTVPATAVVRSCVCVCVYVYVYVYLFSSF
jgi:hypothetical protein